MSKKSGVRRTKGEIAGLVVIIVLSAILLPVLIINVILIVKGSVRPDVLPDVFGVAPLAVVSPSMDGDEEGSFGQGALIFVRLLDEEGKQDLREGDVITFRDGDMYVTHRIFSVEYDDAGNVSGFLTKGDANDFLDPGVLLPENVSGICVGHIEGLGSFAMFLQTPVGILVFVGIPVVAFIALDALRIFLYNRKIRAEEQAVAADEESAVQKELREKEEELARLRALVEAQSGTVAPAVGSAETAAESEPATESAVGANNVTEKETDGGTEFQTPASPSADAPESAPSETDA